MTNSRCDHTSSIKGKYVLISVAQLTGHFKSLKEFTKGIDDIVSRITKAGISAIKKKKKTREKSCLIDKEKNHNHNT